MAVKIRLMRIGTNRKPFYRVVAVDERKKRTGGYLELLGTYNPLTNPKEINLRQDRIDDWIKKGAVPSYGFLRIIGKAPQKAPRKAKKPARNASPARNDAALSGEQSDAAREKKVEPSAEKTVDEQAAKSHNDNKVEVAQTPTETPEQTQETASTENAQPEEATEVKAPEKADS